MFPGRFRRRAQFRFIRHDYRLRLRRRYERFRGRSEGNGEAGFHGEFLVPSFHSNVRF